MNFRDFISAANRSERFYLASIILAFMCIYHEVYAAGLALILVSSTERVVGVIREQRKP